MGTGQGFYRRTFGVSQSSHSLDLAARNAIKEERVRDDDTKQKLSRLALTLWNNDWTDCWCRISLAWDLSGGMVALHEPLPRRRGSFYQIGKHGNQRTQEGTQKILILLGYHNRTKPVGQGHNANLVSLQTLHIINCGFSANSFCVAVCCSAALLRCPCLLACWPAFCPVSLHYDYYVGRIVNHARRLAAAIRRDAMQDDECESEEA